MDHCRQARRAESFAVQGADLCRCGQEAIFGGTWLCFPADVHVTYRTRSLALFSKRPSAPRRGHAGKRSEGMRLIGDGGCPGARPSASGRLRQALAEEAATPIALPQVAARASRPPRNCAAECVPVLRSTCKHCRSRRRPRRFATVPLPTSSPSRRPPWGRRWPARNRCKPAPRAAFHASLERHVRGRPRPPHERGLITAWARPWACRGPATRWPSTSRSGSGAPHRPRQRPYPADHLACLPTSGPIPAPAGTVPESWLAPHPDKPVTSSAGGDDRLDRQDGRRGGQQDGGEDQPHAAQTLRGVADPRCRAGWERTAPRRHRRGRWADRGVATRETVGFLRWRTAFQRKVIDGVSDVEPRPDDADALPTTDPGSPCRRGCRFDR